MKKFLHNIKDEAQRYRMTGAEKSAMLARVLGTPSPTHVQKSPYVFLSYFTHEVRMVMAGFTLFIVAGVGTVSAAAGALPGDILYPVKLSINEKVEMALASDGASKAALEAQLAERRVEEAQSLAVQGRLNAEVADSIAMKFDVHAQNAQDLADASEEAEPGISEQVKTKLSASLAVNAAVLKTLGRGSQSSSTKEQSDMLGDRVIARAEGPKIAMNTRTFAAVAPVAADAVQMKAAGGAGGATMEMESVSFSVATETAVPAEDPGAQKKAARFQKKAAEAVADARQLFGEAKHQLDATTTARVETRFAEADTRMSEGATAMGQGSYALAQEHFMDAFQIANKLSALLRAEKRFDNGILRELIRSELPNGEVEGVSVEAAASAVEPEAREVDLPEPEETTVAPPVIRLQI